MILWEFIKILFYNYLNDFKTGSVRYGELVQSMQDRLICGEYGEMGEFFGGDPPVFSNIKVVQGFGKKSTTVREDQHRTPVITVVDYLEDLIDHDSGTKFLANLANQGLFRAFPWIHLATGKLPVPRMSLVIGSSCDQDFSPIKDHGRGD